MSTPQRQPMWPVILFFITIGVIAGAVLILLTSQPPPVQITILPPPATATPMPTNTPGLLTIYVTGAVAQPASLIQLPAGSRVEDALRAVGGASTTADLERVNLAGVLSDGDQIHVPVLGEISRSLPTPGRAAARVSINRATAAELETLPGVGPSLAQAIVAYRSANGPFNTLNDLDNVPGIGPTLLVQMAEFLMFD